MCCADTDAAKDGGTNEGKPPLGFGFASCLLRQLLNRTTLTLVFWEWYNFPVGIYFKW